MGIEKGREQREDFPWRLVWMSCTVVKLLPAAICCILDRWPVYALLITPQVTPSAAVLIPYTYKMHPHTLPYSPSIPHL